RAQGASHSQSGPHGQAAACTAGISEAQQPAGPTDAGKVILPGAEALEAAAWTSSAGMQQAFSDAATLLVELQAATGPSQAAAVASQVAAGTEVAGKVQQEPAGPAALTGAPQLSETGCSRSS
ncbi:MAG: hypothetical protein ACFB21_09225, partial [Opitutales bacterium]